MALKKQCPGSARSAPFYVSSGYRILLPPLYIGNRLQNHREKPVQIPVLYYISDGSQVVEGWRDIVTSYIASFAESQYEFLDCGHYVHDEIPDVIAEGSIKFIDSLSD